MKNILWIAVCTGIAASTFTCKNATPENSSSPELSNKTTQALLLTQPAAYDPADKDKITGDYVAQSKITVPNDLATQSKWIMFEGPVLENDVIAYRYYADSRHRFDIYGKSVTDLVMDTVSWQYHDIMNWGSDILKVGNSLGLGSPAIWFQDSLYTLSVCQQKTIEIMDNTDSVAMIRTTFKGLQIGAYRFDLVQDWSLRAGKSWSEITLRVLDGELPEGMFFATGIVKHLPEINTGQTANYFYAQNWGEQSFHHENMGMAILAEQAYQPQAIADEWSHAYIFTNAPQKVSYRFLAAWTRGKNAVNSAAEFQKLVEASID